MARRRLRPLRRAHDTPTASSQIGYAGGYTPTAGGALRLVHFGKRYYDPGLGRWTQQDPIDQAGDLRQANRYLYVGQDPINLIDPRGTFLEEVGIVLGVVSTIAGCATAVTGIGAVICGAGLLSTGIGTGFYLSKKPKQTRPNVFRCGNGRRVLNIDDC